MQPVYRPEMLELADRYLDGVRERAALQGRTERTRNRRVRQAAGRVLVHFGSGCCS